MRQDQQASCDCYRRVRYQSSLHAFSLPTQASPFAQCEIRGLSVFWSCTYTLRVPCRPPQPRRYPSPVSIAITPCITVY